MGRLEIFRKKPERNHIWDRFLHFLETTIKCAILLALPLFPTALLVAIWYYALFNRSVFFNEKLEGIITAAWIPAFGILYSILAAVVLSTVWGEYKAIRAAVKKYDVEAFVDLRDEEMSPLVYMLMATLSAAFIGPFMGLKYPDPKSGLFIISSVAYVLWLIFFVVVEIDNPCSGIWFIKSIHAEWMKIDPKTWRAARCEEAKKKFPEDFKRMNGRPWSDESQD